MGQVSMGGYGERGGRRDIRGWRRPRDGPGRFC